MNGLPQPPATNYSAQDLSTRARIRDSALAEFTRHGFRGASIRGIAQAAGVSPGLVQHYFGSKDHLREACDAYVMRVMRDIKDQSFQRGATSDPATLAAQFNQMTPLIEYMVASLSSGSAAAEHWFNDVTDYTYEVLTSGEIGPALSAGQETRLIAAVQSAMALGVAIFFEQLRHIAGQDLTESESLAHIGRARLFLTSERILNPDVAARLREAMSQPHQRGETVRSAETPDDTA